uniref:Caffeic acid-3-O-methyltransferase n=1 Tax=Saccharum hybrid cultivar R570 TaxID=131158 RepID=A0A059PYY0_9POAL|nr:caffeic acid-3-O-methyltransferase [Saccharum hybrid cultivar R570]
MACTTAASLQHDKASDDEACMYAQELLSYFVVPMTLKAVIEIGLIDDLLAADGRSMTPEELTEARWPRPAEAAAAMDHMLRFLASHSVVRCTTEVGPDGKARRSYAAVPVRKWLATRNTGQGSWASLGLLNLRMMNHRYYMKDAAAEGATPTEKAYGMPLFEHLASDEVSSTFFNRRTEMVIKKLLEVYRGFEAIDVLIDVGGGTGSTLRMVTAQYKHLRGVNYDLPHVIAQAPPVQGVEHVGGSMFEYIPSGNAILMKWILHLWRDEECVKILKNCHRALPANCRVGMGGRRGCVGDGRMARTRGGRDHRDSTRARPSQRDGGAKERTEQEFAQLAAEAGFSGGCRATYVFTCAWALEFTK